MGRKAGSKRGAHLKGADNAVGRAASLAQRRLAAADRLPELLGARRWQDSLRLVRAQVRAC